MSQVNIQNLLSLGEQPINIPQTQVAAPNYRSSEFSGGAYQVGAPARTTGPSSEEAMFGALRDIAGGLKTSIDVFGSIRSQVEKNEVDKAKLKYKEIFAGDYTETLDENGKVIRSYNNPAEKMQAWNDYIKNIWTPLLGTNWLTDLNIDAYSSFGNREAQNKFEEERYNRERSKYLTEHPELGNNFSENALVSFDKYYADKYRTAEANQWFQFQQGKNNSTLAEKHNREAINNLGISMGFIIPIPNQTELEAILSGTAEGKKMKNHFSSFFGLVEKGTHDSREMIISTVYDTLKTELIDKNPNNYTQYTLTAIAEVLPIEAKKYADQIFRAAALVRQTQNTQTAKTNLTNAELAFRSSQNPIVDLPYYLQSIWDNHRDAGLNPEQQALLGHELVGGVWEIWNKSAQSGLDSQVLREYPNWNNLSPFEQIKIVSSMVQTKVRSLGAAFGQAEIDIPNFLEQGTNGAIYYNKTFENKVNEWTQRAIGQTNANIQTIGLLGTTESINQVTNASINTLAGRYGLSYDEFRQTYAEFDDKQSLIRFKENATLNLENWYRGLSDDTKKRLNQSGIYLSNIKILENDVLLGLKVEQAALAQRQQVNDGKGGISDEKRNALIKSSRTFSPNIESTSLQNNGYISAGLVTGTYNKTGEDKDYLELVRQVYYAQRTIGSIPNELYNPETGEYSIDKLTPDQQAALAFVSGSSDLIGSFSMPDGSNTLAEHVEALGRLELEVQAIGSTVLRSLPGIEGLTGQTLDNYARVFQEDLTKIAADLITGEAPLFDGRVPQNVYKDGDLTYNGRRFLVQAILSSSNLVRSNNPNEQKQFGDILKTMLEDLGNMRNIDMLLQNPQNMLPLMALTGMGLEYKKAVEQYGSRTVGNAAYLHTRLIMIGNQAEDYSLESVRKFFTSPTFRENADLAMVMPFAVAQMQVGDISTSQYVERGGTLGGAAFPFEIKDTTTQLAQASLLSQTDPVVLEQLSNTTPDTTVLLTDANRITPLSPNWNVQTFIDGWKLAGLIGRDETPTTIANAMTQHILKGSIDPTQPPLNEEETIRRGAQLLHEVSQNQQRLLAYGLQAFRGPVGQHPLFAPQGPESLSGNVFGFLGTVLDIDLVTRDPRFAGSTSIQDTPYNRQFVQVSDSVFGSFYGIANQEPVYSFSNLNFSTSLEPLNSEEGRILGSLVFSNYSPESFGEQNYNGMPFKVGALILESQVDVETFKTAVFNWLNDNQGKINSDKLAIVSRVFSETPNATFKERLQQVQAKYKEFGGTDLLYDEEKFADPQAKGFPTLQQQLDTGSNNSFLPSFSWAHRELNGTPKIIFNDSFFDLWKKSSKKFDYLQPKINETNAKLKTAKPDAFEYIINQRWSPRGF